MNLAEKLASITPDNIVFEINELLKQRDVSINWVGQRMIKVNGYKDTIEIDKLALKYLEAHAFNRNDCRSLSERFDCYQLWEKISQVYAMSERELCKTYFFKYMIPIKEYNLLKTIDSPIAIINGSDFRCSNEWHLISYKDSLFEFTPEEFTKNWGDSEPVKVSWFKHDGYYFKRCIASKEMIENALRQ